MFRLVPSLSLLKEKNRGEGDCLALAVPAPVPPRKPSARDPRHNMGSILHSHAIELRYE
jgi:hypothetical protein